MGYLHQQRHWGEMRKEQMRDIFGPPEKVKPVQNFSVIFNTEDYSQHSAILKLTLRETLRGFFLAYADPDEIYDDEWYFHILKEVIYNSDGTVNPFNFTTRQEEQQFRQDPVGRFWLYVDWMRELFEETIEENKDAIELMYDSINIRDLHVRMCKGAIILTVRGTRA